MRTNTTVVLRLRSAGAEDEYGHTDEIWTETEEKAAWLEQTSEREVTADAETAISDWLLMLPQDVPELSHLDEVLEGGRIFRVQGGIDRKRVPGGRIHHLEARLVLVT